MDGTWSPPQRENLLPGRIICVAADCGGYLLDRGFSPDSKALVPEFEKPISKTIDLRSSQADAELDSRGIPQVARIECITENERALNVRQFVRSRQRGTAPPVDVGFALRLHFNEPLNLNSPLTLGYAAHFGLGLFESE